MRKIFRDQLEANGFSATRYDGQRGVFWTKKVKARDISLFSGALAGGDSSNVLGEEDELILEVCPEGVVQLYDCEINNLEKRVRVETEEGRKLLIDAGIRQSLFQRGKWFA